MSLLLACLAQLLSIGISDAVEFYFNKRVHYEHNCPDIMRMSFRDYNYWHAFLSGIYVSWFLVLAEYLIFYAIGAQFEFAFIISLINIILPVCTNPPFTDDPYLCHTLLYVINIWVFMFTCADV